MKALLLLSLALAASGGRAEAQEYTFGLQASSAFPTGKDLTITTRSGFAPSLGLHLTWAIDDFNSIRYRLEGWRFGQGRQEAMGPPLQRIDTTVQGMSVGVEFIQHFACRHERWAAGLGLYGIRWSVKSTNRLTFSGGTLAQAEGTSSWFQPGVGLVGSCRILPHTHLEARWIASRYGYEDLPARFGTLGLLLTF